MLLRRTEEEGSGRRHDRSQILHGNTACTHLRHLTKLNVTASAYCQARMRLPLRVFQQLLRSVSDAVQPEALDQGRWLGHRTFWVDGSSFGSLVIPSIHNSMIFRA